jgi:hypothetical protein
MRLGKHTWCGLRRGAEAPGAELLPGALALTFLRTVHDNTPAEGRTLFLVFLTPRGIQKELSLWLVFFASTTNRTL